MNMKLSILPATLLAIATSANVNAAVVVDWDLTGLVGTETSMAANSAEIGITGSALTEGAGLIGNTGANSMNAKNWNGEATDYFSFGFSVTGGYQADLSSLVIGTRSSGTGPGILGLFYSGDGYTNSLFTFDQSPGSNYVNSIIDLSGLQNLTGTVEFRVAQIGTTSANGGTTSTAGTFRISEYYDGANYTNLQINGDISAVPVPAAAWLLGSGLIGLVGAARKRKAA